MYLWNQKQYIIKCMTCGMGLHLVVSKLLMSSLYQLFTYIIYYTFNNRTLKSHEKWMIADAH